MVLVSATTAMMRKPCWSRRDGAAAKKGWKAVGLIGATFQRVRDLCARIQDESSQRVMQNFGAGAHSQRDQTSFKQLVWICARHVGEEVSVQFLGEGLTERLQFALHLVLLNNVRLDGPEAKGQSMTSFNEPSYRKSGRRSLLVDTVPRASPYVRVGPSKTRRQSGPMWRIDGR